MSAGPEDIQAYDWNEAGTAMQQNLLHSSLMPRCSVHGLSPMSLHLKVNWISVIPLRQLVASLILRTGSGELEYLQISKQRCAWYFMQYITNKQNEPIIGAKHGGAARMSTWDNPVYARYIKSRIRLNNSRVYEDNS